MRAKMQVNEVLSTSYSDTIKLSPVMGGPGATPEDNSYSKATPSGKLELQIDNPALKGTVKPGDVFYIDLTPIPKA